MTLRPASCEERWRKGRLEGHKGVRIMNLKISHQRASPKGHSGYLFSMYFGIHRGKQSLTEPLVSVPGLFGLHSPEVCGFRFKHKRTGQRPDMKILA